MADIFLSILNISIIASYIVLFIVLIRTLMKKAPKWIRCILWGIVGIRLAVPVSIESIFSLIPSTDTIVKDSVTGSVSVSSGFYTLDSLVNTVAGSLTTGYVNGNESAGINLIELMSYIWLTGALIMILYGIVSTLRIKRSIRESFRVEDNIYVCDYVFSPFILGIIKPKIYIPSNLSDLEAENVLAHERAHLKRHDNIWKPIAFALLSVYWFNPVCWIAYILLCKDIELACDEKVVRDLSGSQIADYSEILLRFSVSRKMISACPVAFGESGTKERVKAMLSYKKPVLWIVVIAIVISVVSAVCLLTNPVSYKSVELTDMMRQTMDVAIEEHNKDIYFTSDNSKAFWDFEVAGSEKKDNHITVYGCLLYSNYSCIDKELVDESGGHCITAITFDISKVVDDGFLKYYKITEYWEAEDGNMLEKSVKEKFPKKYWSKVFNKSSSEQQIAKLENQARAYFDLPEKVISIPEEVYTTMAVSSTGVNISMTELTDKKITVVFENLTGEEFSIGEAFCIYKIGNGVGETKLDPNADIAVDALLHLINNNGVLTLSYDISSYAFENGEAYKIYFGDFGPTPYYITFIYNEEYANSDVLKGEYVYSEGDELWELTIAFMPDGTFSLSEGMVSSYIGMGHYTIDGDVLTIVEDEEVCTGNTNHFKISNKGLMYIEENSDNFYHFKLKDGATLKMKDAKEVEVKLS